MPRPMRLCYFSPFCDATVAYLSMLLIPVRDNQNCRLGIRSGQSMSVTLRIVVSALTISDLYLHSALISLRYCIQANSQWWICSSNEQIRSSWAIKQYKFQRRNQPRKWVNRQYWGGIDPPALEVEIAPATGEENREPTDISAEERVFCKACITIETRAEEQSHSSVGGAAQVMRGNCLVPSMISFSRVLVISMKSLYGGES